MEPKYSLVCFYGTRGRILLQHRKSCNKWGSDWGFFGGHIEKGESALDAAVREVGEELGLRLKKKDLLCLGTTLSPTGFAYTTIYLSKLDFDHKKIRVLEGDGCRLFNEKECGRLKLHPGDVYRTKLIFQFLKLKE